MFRQVMGTIETSNAGSDNRYIERFVLHAGCIQFVWFSAIRIRQGKSPNRLIMYRNPAQSQNNRQK
jgi:hypothetical protein